MNNLISSWWLLIQFLKCLTCEILLDAENTRVWGPGVELADKFTIGARYFFIEPRSSDGNLLTETFKYRVIFSGRSKIGECRVKIEQIDRYDGSAIIRYKLLETCWNVEIHVMHGERHLGKSPFIFKDKLYIENCYCPKHSLEEWLAQVECPLEDPQIENDMIPFRAVNFSSLRPRIIRQYDKPGSVSLCNYVVKDNSIYRTCYGQYTGFKMYMDAILMSLTRKLRLPDMELFVNLGDWPLVTKGGHRRTTGPYPIFSWCGSEDSFDIVMPTYDIVESSLEAMSRVTLDMISVQRRGIPWENKTPKAFWRGRDSRRERLELVGISQRHPDLVNASLTNFFFFRDEEKIYGPKVAYISFFEFFNFKYQINIDGTVAAYRLPYLLGGSSVVFKTESKYYEHFYNKLHRGTHFIGVKADLSDLISKIGYAIQNDYEMLQIRDSAKQFVQDHLLPKSILCYYGLLFKQYSQNIVSSVQVIPGMNKVEQPVASLNCDCDIEVTNAEHDEL
ncbi:protein O-glucosyltransferase 2-like [Uranotaenia lowii]|uniref:protein O-glucosyltransferase 2-like n=1 Tax=Uranotaenia lowii TaxID=190385 RepID=UPI00247AF2C2|nr:protein O-glucosyltransferase 2-like [Uranotaenia lowii]